MTPLPTVRERRSCGLHSSAGCHYAGRPWVNSFALVRPSSNARPLLLGPGNRNPGNGVTGRLDPSFGLAAP